MSAKSLLDVSLTEDELPDLDEEDAFTEPVLVNCAMLIPAIGSLLSIIF